MYVVEEKLEKFNDDIMKEVNEKRRQRLEQVEQEIELTLGKEEIKYLQAAYSKIQEGLKNVHQEKNEIISKAIMTSKGQLLKKRKAIIETICEKTIEKLKAHMATDAYRAYLLKRIGETVKDYDRADEIILYVAAEEKEENIAVLKEHYPWEIKRIEGDDSMIGGFILHHVTGRFRINESFKAKIEDIQNRLYEKIPLDID